MSFVLFILPLNEERPNLRCNCTTTNIGCFPNHLLTVRLKGNVQGICQIDYTSKFPVIPDSKFLNHLLRCSFKQRSKTNMLEICHSCTMYIHKISKDIPSRILPKQKKLSLKRAEVGMKPIYLGDWIKVFIEPFSRTNRRTT